MFEFNDLLGSQDNRQGPARNSSFEDNCDNTGQDIGNKDHTAAQDSPGGNGSSPRESFIFSHIIQPLKEFIRDLWHVLLLILVVRLFLVEPSKIPSESMEPTMLTGDLVIVNKFKYGYSSAHLPFGIRLFEGRIFPGELHRGDIVVFRPNFDRKRHYVKRLIGLPGDRIKIKNSTVYINSKALPRSYLREDITTDGHSVSVYCEEMEGLKYEIYQSRRKGMADNTIEYVVPKDHVFVMGDNRSFSLDSRFLSEVGYVDMGDVVGSPMFVVARFKYWLWKLPLWGINTDRILKPLR